MKRGSTRSLVSPSYQDWQSWPSPDESNFGPDEAKGFALRKEAVCMYVEGRPYEEIFHHCRKSPSETRRLVKRCVEPDGQGGINGFHALIMNRRIATYTRTMGVVPGQGANGKAGCAGAFDMMLRRFPNLVDYIDHHLFKRGKIPIHEARVSFVDLHQKFLAELRTKGVGDYEWPFNTKNRGYNALRAYCRALLEHDCPPGGIKARHGKEAARRRGLGSGFTSLVPTLRCFSTLQLDFHKVDAAGIIVIINAHGEELEVPVSRWHLGFLVEERFKSIAGLYVSLETNPSSDCVLETLESGLRPEEMDATDVRCAYAKDGKILIAQLIPELAFQGFSMLKMDNAWSNCANDVVNNIISTVGCAVNFGPVRAWWRRSLVELIIQKITQRGIQRLPSTFGTGPTDTRKDDPGTQAIKYRIMLSEVVAIAYAAVKEYNENSNEGLQFSSPVSATKLAIANPASGLFRQPLPVPVKEHMTLMMHVEVRTVRGNLKKRIAPYVQIDRCRYHNPLLSQAYHLIGKKLILYIDRRTCETHATVKDTREFLGLMRPEARWATPCSWRLRKLINQTGLSNAYGPRSDTAFTSWSHQKTEDLFNQRKGAKKGAKTKLSKDALLVAKLALHGHTSTDAADSAASLQPQRSAPRDPFGLNG